jgi:hypothetical protein
MRSTARVRNLPPPLTRTPLTRTPLTQYKVKFAAICWTAWPEGRRW